MGKVLLVGASGQLGSSVMTQLVAAGHECIAFVRDSSKFTPLQSNKVRVVRGDLSHLESVEKACVGVDQVIATASAIIPRAGDRFGYPEIQLYQNLITACQKNNVAHLVYISAFSSPYDHLVPEFQVKRKIEALIKSSGVPFTIFRSAPFMDVYFAVMGSQLALEGVEQPTLTRGFWLTSLYAKLTGGVLEKYGIALLPGSGRSRQSFICVQDVAMFMVRALALPAVKNQCFELGGPEALSWRRVAKVYRDVLGRRVSFLRIPTSVLNVLRMVLRVFSPAGENVIGTLSLLGRYDFPIEMKKTSEVFGVSMTGTRRYVQGKLNAQHARLKKVSGHKFVSISKDGVAT